MLLTVVITCMLVNVVFLVVLLGRKATMDVSPPISNNLDPIPPAVLTYSREEVDALIARLNKQITSARTGSCYEYALSPPPYELAARDWIFNRNKEVLVDLRKRVEGHTSIRAVVSWESSSASKQERELRLTGDPSTIVSQVVCMIESWARHTGGTLSLWVELPSVEHELPTKVEVVYLNALGKPETKDIEDRVAALVEVELATERAMLKTGKSRISA